jgi:ABC-type cobalamin transport system permease subunit/predicted small lipoprotein YifL
VLRRPLLAFLAVLVVLVLAACGSDGAPEASPTDAAARPSEPFPVTVESAGGPVTIARRPERIVSLSPTATESLFAIQAGDQVVAVDDQSNYPAEAPRSKLSGYQPNVEAIAGYRPDLVVAAFDPSGLVKGLRKLGIPVLLQPAASRDLRPLAAFIGATVGVFAAYALGRSVGGGRSTATLILAGVTVASFLTAVQTFVQQQNTDTVQEVYAWILGQLETSGWRDVAVLVPYVTVSWVVLLLHRRLLDVLAVGDEEAASLGVNVARVRLVVLGVATLGTAAAVALSGLIAFVGIIVPHAIRLLAGTSYRVVLPLSLAFGAAFLVLADLLARTVISPAELPIGVVTAFFGAPFFALVLRSTRGGGS